MGWGVLPPPPPPHLALARPACPLPRLLHLDQWGFEGPGRTSDAANRVRPALGCANGSVWKEEEEGRPPYAPEEQSPVHLVRLVVVSLLHAGAEFPLDALDASPVAATAAAAAALQGLLLRRHDCGAGRNAEATLAGATSRDVTHARRLPAPPTQQWGDGGRRGTEACGAPPSRDGRVTSRSCDLHLRASRAEAVPAGVS